MTKAELRSLIRNHLRKYDVDVHPNVVDKTIDTVFLQVFNDLFKIDPGSLDNYTKRSALLTATLDTDVYYIDIPNPVFNMRDKAGGVRSVISGEDTVTFYPSTKKECELARNSYTFTNLNTSGGECPYIVKADRVEFDKRIVDSMADVSTMLLTTGVYLYLLQMFSSYSDSDEIPLPFGKGMDIEKFILVFLGNIQPPDLTDNNNSSR